jgi:hypothetical protein
VTWVLADDHDSTVATDDLALVANLLDAWVNLHVSYFLLGVPRNPVEQLPAVTVEVFACPGADTRKLVSGSLFVAVDDAAAG